MDKEDNTNLLRETAMERARNKMGYWKEAGSALLASDGQGLVEKWCDFVDKHVTSDFTKGELLDEMLQIMSMIKLNLPYEVIAKTVMQIPDGLIIIDYYLGAFIHPEILDNIKSYMNTRTM